MKKIRIMAVVLFLITVFLSIAFGFSFLWQFFSTTLYDMRYAHLAEFSDLEFSNLELPMHRDLRVFEISAWIAFALLILNAILFWVKKD